MKRLLAGLTTLASLGLLLVAPLAQAHVLKQDNGTSAVLHIAPFDAPVSGTPTRIEIEFSNTSNTFSLSDYHIQLQLVEAGQTVHTYVVEPAYFGTAVEGLAVVTFPKADVYTFNLKGSSSAAAPFAMQYEVRVTAGKNSAGTVKQGHQVEVLTIAGAVFVVFIMVATKQVIAGKRYAPAKQVKRKEKKHV